MRKPGHYLVCTKELENSSQEYLSHLTECIEKSKKLCDLWELCEIKKRQKK